jgi:glycosyltransferase involved in cell wall biosynthesis
MKELLSITMPVYKRTDYFRKALESAINQTVKCRILVIDNNSPHDEFKKIIDGYNNPLIEYIKTTETVQQEENFNNCIHHCKTPWMTILHDDDFLHIQFVELAEKILKKYKNKIGGYAVKSHVNSKEWDGVSQKVQLTNDYSIVKPTYFYFRQLSPFPGVVFNRDLGLKLNGFNASLFPIADLDFWKRLTENSIILHVNQVLTYYRISPDQSTFTVVDKMINNVYDYRLNLIKERKVHSGLLTRLTVEYVRQTGILFFKSQYPKLEITDNLPNINWLKTVRILMKSEFFTRLINWHLRRMSFENNLTVIIA